MILHTFHCAACITDFNDFTTYSPELRSALPRPCPSCSAPCERVFRPRGQSASIHPSERTVYNYNPQTGEVKFPGRNDIPVHPKLAAAGFERRECTTIADVVRLEKMSNRISERLNYDRGSGTRRPDGVDVD